ncbi:hypothetical protein [Sciscionella sediminilitoris]|uniref:hypothetical protein n=1 Tax=Sciscionella sediminilitoris TaxID=1445613 RepID=UPI0004DFA5ED|nr:hypothetical protein [Sciscionella sp. SE31]
MTAALDLPIDASNVYLGSPGRLRPLPPPKPDVQPEGTRFAPVSRSLDGTGTEWFFGTKRKFKLDLPWCTPGERAWLELCWDGAIQPLWLIDPLTPNRYPKGVASSGSTLRGEQAFNSDAATTTVAEQPDCPNAPPRSVRVTAATYLGYDRLPVVGGETLTFVSWSRASSELTPEVTFTDALGTVLGTTTADTVPGGATTLTKSVLTAPVPDRSAFAAYRLTQAEVGTIVSGAWRAAADGGTEWTNGGGAYRVAFTDKSSSSSRYPLETVSVTLEEL